MSTYQKLTPARQRLVKLMFQVQFGLLRNLRITRGQPDLGPALEVVEDVKLDSQWEPRSEPQPDDFELKDQVKKLFVELDRIGDGTLEELIIRHNLPFRFTFRRSSL